MQNNAAIVAEIKKAIGAHGAWKLKLKTAIAMGASEADPVTVRCDNVCEFGKWLYGPTLDQEIRQGTPYKVIRRLHAEFHDCASRVLSKALAGRKQEAERMMSEEYAARSDKLVRALQKWRGELV